MSSTPMHDESPAIAAPATTEAPIESSLPPPPSTGTFVTVGRRKSAVARVRMLPGDGTILINGRPYDEYFKLVAGRNAVTDPLSKVNCTRHFKILVTVNGGGHHGQADAVRLGISRALILAEKRYEPVLRDHGFLTRDSREVERKKYGRRKARRRYQFSKR